MPRLLRALHRCGGLVAAAGLLLTTAPPAAASFGGGYGGTSGSAIWALAWWQGNPQGPGPFTGTPTDGSDLCIWHDVGPSVSDLSSALSESALPDSFWTAPQSGGHPGIWGVLEWAEYISKRASGTDHFDLVACPAGDEVPPNGGLVQSDLPRAESPQGPVWLWVFWDTVVDPPPSDLPPVVEEAYAATELPKPVLAMSPDEIDGVADATVVNFPTWLWIDSSIWHSYSATAEAGGLVATVWAYPVAVRWSASWDFPAAADDPQHGVSLAPEDFATTCDSPGIVYWPPDAWEEPDACTATFSEPTFGTRRPLVARVSWVVHWAVSSPAGVVGGEGLFPDLYTRASLGLRVMQIESIISSG